MNQYTKSNRGFSLIELLMVLAIIGIIAAIAVPNLAESKKAGNEASALASVRNLTTAQMTYSSTAGSGAFSSLTDLQAAGLIDNVLGTGTKEGYTFTVAPNGSTSFSITAVPSIPGITGEKGYYSDQTAVIRYTVDGSAPTVNSPAVGTQSGGS